MAKSPKTRRFRITSWCFLCLLWAVVPDVCHADDRVVLPPAQATQTRAFQAAAALENALRADFKLDVHLANREVVRLYKQACALGLKTACAYRHWRGHYGASRRLTARKWIRQSCELDDAGACLIDALWQLRSYMRDEDNEAKLEQAASALTKQCRRGWLLACVELAHLAPARFRGGAAVQLRSLESLCGRHSAAACGWVANALRIGATLPQDLQEARRYGQIACRGGDGKGCEVVADLDLEQPEAPAMGEAAELYLRACTQGEASACLSVAQQYLHGLGVARSRDSFIALATRSCRGGHKPACFRLYQEGGAIPSGSGWVPPRVGDVRLVGGASRRTESYGGALVVGYVVGILGAPFTAGLTLLTPSIVHAAHGQGGRALLAPLGLAGMTTGGALIGGLAGGNDFGATILLGFVGGLAGMVGWVAIDVSYNSDREYRPSVVWTPTVTPYRDGAVVGVTGTF